MTIIQRPTDDEVQTLSNEARLWLRLIDEGRIIPVFNPRDGIDPQYVRYRLNDLEAALKPFDPRGCIGDEV